VWSQELFPTLLRGSAQGVTMAFARVAAAAFALVTPAIATSNPTALFAILLSCMVVSGVFAFVWVARLPRTVPTRPTAPNPALLPTNAAAGDEHRRRLRDR